jgi:hypothetical protein
MMLPRLRQLGCRRGNQSELLRAAWDDTDGCDHHPTRRFRAVTIHTTASNQYVGAAISFDQALALSSWKPQGYIDVSVSAAGHPPRHRSHDLLDEDLAGTGVDPTICLANGIHQRPWLF